MVSAQNLGIALIVIGIIVAIVGWGVIGLALVVGGLALLIIPALSRP